LQSLAPPMGAHAARLPPLVRENIRLLSMWKLGFLCASGLYGWQPSGSGRVLCAMASGLEFDSIDGRIHWADGRDIARPSLTPMLEQWFMRSSSEPLGKLG
jgi:hypothetical protein